MNSVDVPWVNKTATCESLERILGVPLDISAFTYNSTYDEKKKYIPRLPDQRSKFFEYTYNSNEKKLPLINNHHWNLDQQCAFQCASTE